MSTITSSFRFLSKARCAAIFARSWIRLLISYSTGTISILPDSILEKSKISLISESSVCPAIWISIAYSLIFCSLDSRRIISSMPRTALIGVRISCDICARNLPLASFAASASWRAASASCFACASCKFCCSAAITLSCRSCAFSSAFARYSLESCKVCITTIEMENMVILY